jgi:hypothetical protein
MRPLRTDSDFLALAKVGGSAAFARACACVSGTYTKPLARTFPWGHGWSFTVTSDRGNQWSVRIAVDEVKRRYRVNVRKI